MVRMTITLEKRVVDEAKRLSGTRTRSGAIEAALEAYARLLRQRQVLAHEGKIRLTLTQRGLRRWRATR